MDEIKFETQNKNKSGKNIGVIIAVSVIVFLIICFSVAALSDTASNEKLEISGTTLEVEYSEYLGYSATIKGVAKNNTKKNYSYASVEFSVYDAAGNNLGTAWANINNLASGDSWSFEATLLNFPSTRPTSFKLVEVDAW